MRKYREDFTKLDKLHMALTELSYALNYSPIIQVWGHGFVPREFFIHNLEGRFNKALPGTLASIITTVSTFSHLHISKYSQFLYVYLAETKFLRHMY